MEHFKNLTIESVYSDELKKWVFTAYTTKTKTTISSGIGNYLREVILHTKEQVAFCMSEDMHDGLCGIFNRLRAKAMDNMEKEIEQASKDRHSFNELSDNAKHVAVEAWKAFVNEDGSLDGFTEDELRFACGLSDYHFTKDGELYRDIHGIVS